MFRSPIRRSIRLNSHRATARARKTNSRPKRAKVASASPIASISTPKLRPSKSDEKSPICRLQTMPILAKASAKPLISTSSSKIPPRPTPREFIPSPIHSISAPNAPTPHKALPPHPAANRSKSNGTNQKTPNPTKSTTAPKAHSSIKAQNPKKSPAHRRPPPPRPRRRSKTRFPPT